MQAWDTTLQAALRRGLSFGGGFSWSASAATRTTLAASRARLRRLVAATLPRAAEGGVRVRCAAAGGAGLNVHVVDPEAGC